MEEGEADIPSAIDAVLPLIEVEFKDKEIEISQVIERNLPLIKGSQPLVQAVLLNLLTNACQAAGRSGRVEIAAEVVAERVRVSVRDNGPGIPEGMRKQIFEPFFTTKKGTGSGLGLYLVKQFVERMGGAISVESKEGEGTVFTLEF